MTEKAYKTSRPLFLPYVKVTISLAFGVFLLWLIGRGQNIDLIIKEFRNANYLWILMAAGMSVLSHLVRALRWNLLIRSMGYTTTTWHTFNALMTGYLSNLAIPRLGEITRCMVLGRLIRTPFNTLIGTVVSERIFDMFSLILLLFFTIAFQFDFLKDFIYRFFVSHIMQKGEENWPLLLFLALAASIILIFAFFFFRKKFRSSGETGFYFKLHNQLQGLKNGLLTIWTIREKWLFVLYSLLMWALYFSTVYLVFFAIQATAHLNVAAGITLLVVGSLGIVAPVPGGIGTYHFLTIATLTELYGIAAEPAISYAYIAHASQTFVILITGAVAWAIISFVWKKAPHPVRQKP